MKLFSRITSFFSPRSARLERRVSETARFVRVHDREKLDQEFDACLAELKTSQRKLKQLAERCSA